MAKQTRQQAAQTQRDTVANEFNQDGKPGSPDVAPIAPTPDSIAASATNLTNSLNDTYNEVDNLSGEASTAENNGATGASDTWTPIPPSNTPTGATATNANQVVSDWLGSIGLGSIAPQVLAWSAKGYSPAVLLSMIKTDPSTAPAYQARFPALAQLQKTNPAMTEGDYIAKENADRGMLYQYLGPAAEAFDNTNSLGNIMTQLIGTNELQSRLQAIHDEANASSDTKAWMKNTYGLSDQDVAAAWLDPKLTADQVALRDTASQIGGAGLTSGFGTLTQAQAEALAQNGVTQSQAQNTFAKIGNYGQLEQTLPGNDSGSLTQQQILDGSFNGGAAAAQLQAVQGARVAQFQEGGGMQADSSGVTGDRSGATL